MKDITIKDRLFEVYLGDQQLSARVAELAKEITARHEAQEVLFIGVLNGSFMFASDLLKNISFPCNISFIRVASYEGTKSSGQVNEVLGLKEKIEGRHVIILEDIVDTGLTIKHLVEDLISRRPASLHIATLLLKKECLQTDIRPEYVGFEVPDKFLVGYGLDYDGYGRNLRHIYAEKKQ